jgi:hypothetical protein
MSTQIVSNLKFSLMLFGWKEKLFNLMLLENLTTKT